MPPVSKSLMMDKVKQRMCINRTIHHSYALAIASLAMAAIAFTQLYAFHWVFRPEMTFYVDDWAWLVRSHFRAWVDYLSIWTVLPSDAYNDRPIGVLLIKLLYQFFGLNYIGYGAFLQALHFANAIVFYLVAARLLKSRFYGALASLLFVANLNVAYLGFDPYAPRFDLPTVISGIKLYCNEIGFELLGQNNALLAYLILLACAIATGNRVAIFAGLAFIIAASPVLVLAAQRVPYYAYIPAPYFILLLLANVRHLEEVYPSQLRELRSHAIRGAMLVTAGWLIHQHISFGFYRDTLLLTMEESTRAMRSLLVAAPKIENGSNVVILGVPPSVNLFSYAPCHAIMVMYLIPSIKCRIDGSDRDLRAIYKKLESPKLLLDYGGGNVSVQSQE